MTQKIIHFIKYHNAFTIGMVLLFVFSGAIFASEGAREATIGKKIVNEQGIDNSAILAVDLGNFDLAMTITGVSEDPQNYHIDYSYQTLTIQGNSWQDILKKNTLTVSKKTLGGKDLGLYAQKQLGEVLDAELVYLRKVQALEKAKGETFVQETTEYTGLIGLVLEPKTKILPGYELVIKPINQIAATVGQEDIVDEVTRLIRGNSEASEVCQNGVNRPCSSEIGACQIGVQICEQGVWGECIGAVLPTEEVIDEVDNDCDGQVDEGLSMPEPALEPAVEETEFPEGNSVSTDELTSTDEPEEESDIPLSDSGTSTPDVNGEETEPEPAGDGGVYDIPQQVSDVGNPSTTDATTEVSTSTSTSAGSP